MIPPQQEKRRFYRHPIGVPIQYREVRAKTHCRSKSVDLSEGGICFLADHFLAMGVSINLDIPVESEVFSMSGHVAYCNRLSNTGLYRTGVAFEDPTSAFRAKLAEELLKIKDYRKKLIEELGRDVSEDEAARKWIEKYAKRFSGLF